MLGEREVRGGVDRDRIEVGRSVGAFDKLTIVVENGDLELIDFAVQFHNGGTGPQNWHPELKHYFREGQRTRAIDVPGINRTIRWFDLKYRNLAPGSRAKVSVWGFRVGGESAADPQNIVRRRPVFDPKGWVPLGSREVTGGGVDTARLDIGKDKGAFKKITLVVEDSDLEMVDFAIQFANGGPGPQNWHPTIKRHFREGERTREIDLPGSNRTMKWADFKFRNLAGGGRAKVTLWGWRAGNANAADPEYKDRNKK